MPMKMCKVFYFQTTDRIELLTKFLWESQIASSFQTIDHHRNY